MSLFRSERMGYYNIVLPRTYAWEVMNELGETNAIEFVDQNAHENTFTRPYSNYVKRCEDMENKIRNIEAEMVKFGKEIKPCDDHKYFLNKQKDKLNARDKAGHTYFEELEGDLDDKLRKLNEQIKTYDNLVEKYTRLVEYKQVLALTKPHLGNRDFRARNAAQDEEEKLDYVAPKDVKFSYLAGVIDKEDSLRFKRILFRVTRGMVYTVLIDIDKVDKEDELEDPMERKPGEEPKEKGVAEQPKQKTVFLIIYQGGGRDMLKGRLNKICDSFGASKYGIPEDQISFERKMQEVNQQLRDAKNIIFTTKYAINKLLQQFAETTDPNPNYPSYIEEVRLYVLKEKSIYHNLNMLKTQQQMLYGYCWCPLETEEKVRKQIQQLSSRQQHIFGVEFNLNPRPEGSKPPTYFRLNEFTWVFQEIVNTYGIPRYREVNPGLYTIATFPFLFGVMFGDIGHGALLFAFGVYLTWKAEEIKAGKGLLAMILPARYLILLMGFFAFYCGMIYNDFMSIPFNLFGSCYDMNDAEAGVMIDKNAGCTYPFGLDPAWYGTQNELTFFNSLKMKLAVILGVAQMTFGIFLKSINTIHFGQPLEFLFEFLPQIVFMLCTFVYMDILIFIKWATPWGTAEYPIGNAPSIITTMINMPLKLGSTEGQNLYGTGNEQSEIQLILLLVALICVPLMLFPKPIIQLIQNKMKANTEHRRLDDDESLKQKLIDSSHEEGKDHVGEIPANKFDIEVPAKQKPAAAPSGGHGEHGEFEFGEVFVHQIIETIEFVLGSISNTASYLRLWALSLAHGQLATVFFENTIGSAIVDGSIVGAFIGFFVFANVTFAVLMCMDVMECFLHALRLHWVEFQNKFYKADGHSFVPFSFEESLKAAPK